MLAAILIVTAQQPDAHAKAWLDALRPVAKAERASLCVDVDEDRLPAPFHYPNRDGYRGLDRLASAIDRTRLTVEGVHVFRRRYDPNDLRRSTPHEHVLA